MNRGLICAAWLLALLASLGFAQQSAQSPAPAPPEQNAVAPWPNFRLSPGDAIEVRFFYNPELDTRVQIRPDGHISLALAGDVDLNNRTVLEATQHLEQVYRRVLRTPAITIQAVSYASQKAYVAGEVLRPGVVTLSAKMTVLDAIMETGGMKYSARSSSIVLIRKSENGDPVTRTISMKSSHDEPSEASQIFVRPYDVILVPESKIARADRWVDQHIRQLIPGTMSAGFSYLANGATFAH